jgi:NitT/TauT family transport system substrate-binding protein
MIGHLLYLFYGLSVRNLEAPRRTLIVRTFSHRVAPIALLMAALMLVASCGSSSKSSSTGTTTAGGSSGTTTLRLGYLPNVTHAPAIVGLQNKTFQNDVGSDVNIKTSTYNSGTDETTALLAGALDAAFVGPNPAINAYQKSNGTLIRIVSGVASGGAFLVVKPSITSPADLKGKKLATPSLGNTQDVALRTWLAGKGYKTTTEGGGDVTIVPQDNSLTLTAFESGAIDGAWVPEPYATQLQQEGGKVLVNEATLWPKGQFVTTNLVVATKYLSAHPDVISNLLKGLDSSINLIKTDPTQAEKLVSEGIGSVKGKAPATSLVATSFKSITFTLDPIASSLKTDAAHAKALGLIDSTDLKNIYDLTLLNKMLTAQGKAAITP